MFSVRSQNLPIVETGDFLVIYVISFRSDRNYPVQFLDTYFIHVQLVENLSRWWSGGKSENDGFQLNVKPQLSDIDAKRISPNRNDKVSRRLVNVMERGSMKTAFYHRFPLVPIRIATDQLSNVKPPRNFIPR